MVMMENVVQLNVKDDKNVWNCINTFLTRAEQNSKNTRRTYERAIREFFKIMRNKKLEDLIEEDLIFTKPQIETYQTRLKEKYKASTVNNKISALKKCYTKLEDYGFDVKPSWFSLDRYSEHDKNPSDPMTHQEVIDVINLVSETRKGFEKALLIRVAYSTAFRKTAIQNLKWTDIINREGQWFLKALDKGNKWDYKKISDDLYDELMKQKELIRGEKIFQLTNKSINKMMNYIRDNMDFGERNITFHSFKKSSIKEVALLTNYDLKAMQRHGNHSNVMTTLNDYMEEKSLDDLVVVDTNHRVPVEEFDKLTRDELLDLIKNSDRNVQMKLLQDMEVI